MGFGQPFHQAAGNVQADRNLRLLPQDLEKGGIAIAIGIFEDAVKIADGLMNMNGQRQTQTSDDPSWLGLRGEGPSRPIKSR
jgi:hypothetical protein